ncbi:LLM class flavin-dependent oxidoreductase [Agromyces aurantiacus]|uniref:LLM class flavin-dependent oxidoreductase n=1 Tax=Agromyces aurantiacus TaxID=165814 RepID=A0ABV9R2H8_9MICO|nr:LLM class flavin-dependent oxidoreductase [Agromyces aurantiacus]MBM7506103.1 alkanesulfonate monooxygenase SsuD/methylene tetrahydromethanopterin reductase-like flavin-dependent oxidoreductase (luciferase family) [Agromyces aurantiacus]
MRAALSIGLPGTTDHATLRALAPRLERLGFDRLWLNDVPGGDSLAGLRVVAEVTDRLGLATGVIPLDRRPVEKLDLSGLPAGRTTIGIGSGGARHPLELVSAGLADLRARTTAALAVGALGPRMRRLAARKADAVLLNWLTPTAAQHAMEDLHRDAGDRAGSVRGVLYVRTIVDGAARAALQREADRYGSYSSYAANFARLGVSPIDATIDRGATLAAYDVVDEVVLRAITVEGTLAELERFADEAARWRAAAAPAEE